MITIGNDKYFRNIPNKRGAMLSEEMVMSNTFAE